ncbi:hypothetical protein BU25DRAFT_457662 [Macroventuria anomochaeta]|uniref:Uncharacterized protein n=1 Tax=Macroventuria anomochaeta TaxID=301207 RepID=A0ACB6S5C5_9PLEO|nr:uncharacterized protein BU25DRAFT_457662 [Macroventuria anomochaeta]KAF2628327.1 hypothetical protein BU25DRAFT_457662 [Macroventuria anomochaeta]
MSSSNTYTAITSSISKEIATTPATSVTFFDKPTWDRKPAFEHSEHVQGEFNNIGDNWSDDDWPTQEAFNDSTSPATPSSHSDFVLESSWGTGPAVEIPAYHTHFTIIDSMDQRSGYTHYLLESNRGLLFHGHHPTAGFEKLKAIGGDGSEFASLPDMIPVAANSLFPPRRGSMTDFQGDKDSREVYMKKQALLMRDQFKNDHHASCTWQEVSRCERISKAPHPNLARYLGVETRSIGDEARVVGIAYQRYTMDMHNFVLVKRYLQPHHIPFLMQGIEKGMHHLHELGLVHCDLRPMNIFVTIEDQKDGNGHVVLKEVVIGDFDASVEIGKKVALKRASKEWWPTETEWGVKAEEWIDEWCLEKMGKWLKEDGLGVWGFGGSSSPEETTDNLADEILAALPNHGW